MSPDRLDDYLARHGGTVLMLSRAGFALCLVAICVLSLLPSEEMPDVRLSDKIGHLVAYGALAVLALLSYRRRTARWPTFWALIALGTLLELAQLWVPGRSSELLDLAMNYLGVIAGVIGMRLAVRALPSLGPAAH